MPGRPNLSIGPVIPHGPERTYRFLDYFVAAGRERGVDPGSARVRRPGRAEDRALVERVQAGVVGTARRRPPAPESALVAHFQQLLVDALGT